MKELDAKIVALNAEFKVISVKRPKAEKDRDAKAEQRRQCKAELEDLRNAIIAAIKVSVTSLIIFEPFFFDELCVLVVRS